MSIEFVETHVLPDISALHSLPNLQVLDLKVHFSEMKRSILGLLDPSRGQVCLAVVGFLWFCVFLSRFADVLGVLRVETMM